MKTFTYQVQKTTTQLSDEELLGEYDKAPGDTELRAEVLSRLSRARVNVLQNVGQNFNPWQGQNYGIGGNQ